MKFHHNMNKKPNDTVKRKFK